MYHFDVDKLFWIHVPTLSLPPNYKWGTAWESARNFFIGSIPMSRILGPVTHRSTKTIPVSRVDTSHKRNWGHFFSFSTYYPHLYPTSHSEPNLGLEISHRDFESSPKEGGDVKIKLILHKKAAGWVHNEDPQTPHWILPVLGEPVNGFPIPHCLLPSSPLTSLYCYCLR